MCRHTRVCRVASSVEFRSTVFSPPSHDIRATHTHTWRILRLSFSVPLIYPILCPVDHCCMHANRPGDGSSTFVSSDRFTSMNTQRAFYHHPPCQTNPWFSRVIIHYSRSKNVHHEDHRWIPTPWMAIVADPDKVLLVLLPPQEPWASSFARA